ncbi:nitrite reductase [Halopseudomonas bauzanensis]|nr:nitrite reductase [Halopseudomonas bauzanensis]
MKQQRLVVVGNGMVGQKYLEHLVAGGLHQHYQVTVLCAEPRPAYDRVHLSAFFTGRSSEDLCLVPAGFFERHGIELRVGEGAEHIDLNSKTVLTSKGAMLGYDKLVLATGSYPFVPPLPGRERPGCLTYRTIEDLQAIMAAGRDAEVGVVIGGGLLGLEAAKSLHDIGLQTHVLEFAPRLMAVQVDDGGGKLLRRKIEQLGVSVHTGMSTTEIVDGEFYRHRLNFADGQHLEADLVVFSAGIRPQDSLARDAGLAVGERGGIVIDDHCRTSDPAVYAIGECALWGGRIYGLVAPGYEMARVAVDHLRHARDGTPTRQFTGADMSTKLKLMGVDVASFGDAHASTPGACCYRYEDERKQIYKKLVVSEDGRQLLGGVLVGEAREYNTLLQLMLNAMPLPETPEQLILPALGAPLNLDVTQLPDSAILCQCQNVSKGALCQALADGCCDLAAIKTCTGAATGCGSCEPLVRTLLEASETLAGALAEMDA